MQTEKKRKRKGEGEGGVYCNVRGFVGEPNLNIEQSNEEAITRREQRLN